MNTENIERVHLAEGRLRVVTAGSGPALVYLHGTGDQGELLPVLRTLAENHFVVRPDHAGFIESDDCDAQSIADVAALHERMLNELGIDDFILVGCSLGGWVAAELALRLSDRITLLVLIDPAGLAGDGSAPDMFRLSPEEVLALTVHDEGRREAARSAVPDPQVLARLARSRASALRLAGDPYMHDPSLADRLSGLRMPVRLLWGREDGIVPLSYAAAWQQALPQALLSVVPSAGHLPHVEKPDSLLGLVDRVVPSWS